MDIFCKLKSYLLCTVAGMLFLPSEVCAKVTVSEIMPCNISSLLDKDYNFQSWIEFYNDGGDVDLKGATIKNLKGSKVKWETVCKESHVIKKGYTILFLGGNKEVTRSDGSKYIGSIPYKMEYVAGAIQVILPGGDTLASLDYPQQYPFLSYGAKGYMEPTPTEKNEKGYDISKRVSKPAFGKEPGLYADATEMEITLSCATEGAEIYYTIGGNEPTMEKGTPYTGAIKIKGSKAIRARAYKDGMLSSDVLTGTYILDDGTYKYCKEGKRLPIVSIVTDSAYLYSNDMGIYVVGTNGVEGASSCVKERANYNRKWDRPANFEYIENGETKENKLIEIGVFGGCSRRSDYKVKSLKLKASKKTGQNRYNYTEFFKDKKFTELKSMKLRNGGNAYSENEYNVHVRCRDGFMNSIAKAMNIDYHAYQPVAYYINGVYKGLMGLREQTNEDYVFSNYGYDEDEIDEVEITKAGVETVVGDQEWYDLMINYVEKHYSDKDFYERLSEYMDVEEYVDYMIFEQFIVNTDWVSNNARLWRRKKDGKFRWILYDTDFGLGLYESGWPNYCSADLDMINYCSGTGDVSNWGNGDSETYALTKEVAWKTTLFKHCMMNEDFQRRYVTRSLEALETSLSYKTVKAVWDSLSPIVAKDYCATFWPKESYQRSVDKDAKSMLEFAERRVDVVKGQLNKKFGVAQDRVKFNFKMACDTAVPGFAFLFNKQKRDATSMSYEGWIGQSVKIEPIIPHGYEIESWGLSNSVYSQDVLLDPQTRWAYFYDSIAPTGNWKALEYDETGWKTGKGKMGYRENEDGGYDTRLDYGKDSKNKYITAYFRAKFSAKKNEYKKVTFSLTYDDGAVVYLNGREIARYNMDSTASAFGADNKALDYVNDEVASFTIDGAKLADGENVIAIEIHQNSGTSGDLTMAMNATGYSNPKNEVDGEVFENVLSENLTLTLKLKVKSDYKSPKLYINEVCASNDMIEDEYGKKPDWIEVYNAENYDVDLAGMVLSNETKTLETVFERGRGDLVIPAGGHKVLWADKNGLDGPLHLDFKLSASAKQKLAMYDVVRGKRVQISNMTYELHDKNHSYGRTEDGGAKMEEFHDCSDATDLAKIIPTPGEANGEVCQVVGDDILDSIADVERGMTLYPNPASDFLMVELKSHENAILYIYDNMGRMVMSGNIVDGVRAVSVEGLAQGVYVVKVITGEDVFTERFIKN